MAKFDVLTVLEPMHAEAGGEEAVETAKALAVGKVSAEPVAALDDADVVEPAPDPEKLPVWAASGAALRGLILKAHDLNDGPLANYTILGVHIRRDGSLPDDIVELRIPGQEPVRQTIPAGDHLDEWKALGTPTGDPTAARAWTLYT